MTSIPGLTPELDAAVRAELRPGEELWYAGMPSPSRTGRKAIPIAIFGLFFGGFAAFWIAMAAGGVWFAKKNDGDSNVPGLFMLFPLFGLPFLLVGLGMILSPWWIARAARRTACCVTGTRALQVAVGKSVRIQSWSPADLDEISKELYPDGTGTVTFAKSVTFTSRGRARKSNDAFYGVPDPRACEEALLALKATASGTTANAAPESPA